MGTEPCSIGITEAWRSQSTTIGFGALVSLRCYIRDTVNTLLHSYLREYLHTLDFRLVQVEATSTAPNHKTTAHMECEKLEKAQ